MATGQSLRSVDLPLVKALPNDSPGGDMTLEHYLNSIGFDVLLSASQKTADWLVERMGAEAAGLLGLLD